MRLILTLGHSAMRFLRGLFYLPLLAVTLGSALGTVTPASATVILPEFQIIETAGPGNTGEYTLINNSGSLTHTTAEYIYGFSVTNPLASSVSDWTTERGWDALKVPLFGRHKTGFAYATLPGFWEFSHRHFVFDVNPETIGPGEQSSNFFFGTSLLASDATLLLVSGTGEFSTFKLKSTSGFPVTPAVP